MRDPDKALDAVLTPAKLGLGQICMLEKIDSPLIRGGKATMSEIAASVYLLSMPLTDAIGHMATADQDALLWMQGIPWDDWQLRKNEACDAVRQFFDMLPSAEDGTQKKSTQTD